MRYQNLEETGEQGCGTTGTALTFLLIGVGIGAALALLYAPKAGKQLRRDMRRRYDDVRETIDDWKSDARDVAEEVMERGAEFAEEFRERISPLAKNFRKG